MDGGTGMNLKEWKQIARRGTSGDQVWDILTDWENEQKKFGWHDASELTEAQGYKQLLIDLPDRPCQLIVYHSGEKLWDSFRWMEVPE
jgi:hypothetical protein